jgi:hypothetical protein
MNRASALRFVALATLLAVGSCSTCQGKTAATPLITSATRGTVQIDVYGFWTRTNDPLGRAPKSWAYQLKYVRAGTTVYTDGTTDGPAIDALDAGTVTWSWTALVDTTQTTGPTPDANGTANATLKFVPPGRGSATLYIDFTYGGGSGRDSTKFEVDYQAP